MLFPDVLEPFRLSSRRYLDEGRIREVLFSGSTYQIEIQDIATEEPVWVFVQIRGEEIKDIFCSCQVSSDTGVCEHMAAACQYLTKNSPTPLHDRFHTSLYHLLFHELFLRSGFKDPKASEENGLITVEGARGKVLFHLRVKNKEKAHSIFFERKEETEENSIKFSSLSEEELDAWRHAKPSSELRYELSFVSDLAKHLFLHEEPVVTFHEHEGSLPGKISIESSLGRIDVVLDEALLEHIIPTLTFTKSSLQYSYVRVQEVQNIAYKVDRKEFRLQIEEDSRLEKLPIGSFYYIYKEGFCKQHKEKEVVIRGDEIGIFLDLHYPFLKKSMPLVVDEKIHSPTFHLTMTDAKELEIEAYLHERGDLKKKHSTRFSAWAYVDSKGFYRLEPQKFEEIRTKISGEHIDPFLMQNRFWMQQFPQFQVHVAQVAEKISYKVSSDGILIFHKEKSKEHAIKPTYDLGRWFYAKNRGFFLKETKADQSQTFIFDQPIPKVRVPDFILRHADVLSHIPNFFSHESPVAKMHIHVRLKKQGLIEVDPEYEWVDEKLKKAAILFDEFIFVPGKGFYRLPATFCPLHYVREIKSQDREVWNQFFIEELPRLQANFSCKVDKRLEKISNFSIAMTELDVNKDSTWSVNLTLDTGAERVAIPALLQAKKRGDRFFPTNAGVLDLEDERFHFLSQLQLKKAPKSSSFTLSSVDLLRLQAYEPIVIDKESVFAEPEQKEALEKLLQGANRELPRYPALQATLRPYQQKGVEWLYYLYQNQLSGLLSDDMGVGKTHQAMALIASVHESLKQENKKSRFLIICPTSLVYHWEEKLHQFLPELRVKSYITQARTLIDAEGYEIVLTTYGIYRSDVNYFKPLQFDVAIFDELQIAKNHVSQIHGALLKVNAWMRVGLTGTPIENELRELKAVFDLILPGYMPEESGFREFFVRPIEREMNDERKRLLGRLVKPFILRRKKQEVLPDLPMKTEEICHVELLGEQKNLYKQVATMQATALLQQLQDDEQPIPYMHIFALLTSLKQICNHPAAYLKDPENYSRYESGKWERFIELLEEAEESNQKVVVFSQYLGMLDIMKAYFEKMKIGFAEIRGETRFRGEEVSRFQNDPKCRVFLGSLQAAGLGIDLTAAEIVVHYDRWWNPARENQATDRVHRFGQKRGVQVFKMVSKETIEEKIDAMIERKKGLLEDIITFDDQNVVKKMSREEIIGLLEEMKG